MRGWRNHAENLDKRKVPQRKTQGHAHRNAAGTRSGTRPKERQDAYGVARAAVAKADRRWRGANRGTDRNHCFAACRTISRKRTIEWSTRGTAVLRNSKSKQVSPLLTLTNTSRTRPSPGIPAAIRNLPANKVYNARPRSSWNTIVLIETCADFCSDTDHL